MGKKAGMATHSQDSFNESSGNRVLSGILESTRTMKTYFGENDKTPNHDGFFELLNLAITDSNKPPKSNLLYRLKQSKT